MPELSVNGLRVFYREEGNGPPLMLLHGLGSSSRDWEYQFPAFAPRYRTVAPDLRGFGRSERPPGPYRIEGFADDAFALARALDLGRFHVLGLSMGGAVALQMAVDDSDGLRSCTVVNSLTGFRPEGWKQRLAVLFRRWAFRLLGIRGFARLMARRLFPRDDQAELREQFRERFRDNDPASYRAAFEALVGWDVSDRLEDIRCPVQVVAADGDYWPVSTKREYARRIPDARVAVIEDSRHATPVDRPEAFNRRVLDFLAEVEESPAASGEAPDRL